LGHIDGSAAVAAGVGDAHDNDEDSDERSEGGGGEVGEKVIFHGGLRSDKYKLNFVYFFAEKIKLSYQVGMIKE
jgi:hypothetical protein